jgi:hypothetical protein
VLRSDPRCDVPIDSTSFPNLTPETFVPGDETFCVSATVGPELCRVVPFSWPSDLLVCAGPKRSAALPIVGNFGSEWVRNLILSPHLSPLRIREITTATQSPVRFGIDYFHPRRYRGPRTRIEFHFEQQRPFDLLFDEAAVCI